MVVVVIDVVSVVDIVISFMLMIALYFVRGYLLSCHTQWAVYRHR